jgi:hypothetical protein
MEKIYDIVKHRSYPLKDICINKELTKKHSKRSVMVEMSSCNKLEKGRVIYACKGCILSPKTRIYDNLPIYVTENTYQNLKAENYIL